MILSKNEFAFLVYFLPLFALKIANVTAESQLLVLTGVVCLILFGILATRIRYSNQLLLLFLLLLSFAAILVITTGKQAVFFSVIILFAMKDINLSRRVYRICFVVGLIFLVVACYINRVGDETMRFFNGDWSPMLKRSNILYISYTAVLCLYLLIYKNSINYKHLAGITILSYLMFNYVGSRTGFYSILLLIILIFVLRNKYLSKLKIVRYSCILSPLFSMLFSILTGLLYGKSDIITLFDLLLQGRISQNNFFLNQYDIKLFGQKIYESVSQIDYRVLDSAYIDMLVHQGLILSILWITITILVIKYMYSNNRFIEVAILVMYAIYGISETFLLNGFLNISLLIYGEYIYIKIFIILNKSKSTKSLT